MERIARIAMHVVVALVLGLLLGCNNTPTVPIPPPEMTMVSPPGQDGYATVSGDPGVAEEGDIILVFNFSLNAGVMVLAAGNGSFEVDIEAEAGDRLLVQIKRDNELSEEEELFVPSL